MMTKKTVWLLLGYYEHDIYRGIVSYSRKANWQLYRPVFFRNGEVPSSLKSADGIISLHASIPEIVDILKKSKAPVVDMDKDIGLDVTRTYTDDYEIGRMTARHFTERGFINLAFLKNGSSECHEIPRSKGFLEEAERLGRKVRVLNYNGSEEYFSWLSKIVKTLNYPTGIMCNSDLEADNLINICLEQKISVPQQVSIIGVKSDDIIGESGIIPISCVDANCFELGYQSAKLLDSLMNGEKKPTDTLLIKPKEIIVRQSSDIMAVSHPQVLAAIKFTKENFHTTINVEDVVRHVSISQRQLNKLFKKFLGHSILKELTNLRLEKAKRMLIETDEKIKFIALDCGFSNSHRMNIIFHRELKYSPKEFRNLNKSIKRSYSDQLAT